MENRLQNLAITLDKLNFFLRHQPVDLQQVIYTSSEELLAFSSCHVIQAEYNAWLLTSMHTIGYGKLLPEEVS